METYAGVQKGFDRLAPHYEELIEANPLHASLRRLSIAWLDQAFRPGMHVVEIGCGTGTEAMHLARRGIRVTATDVSDVMVQSTRERVRQEGLERMVQVVHCAAGQLSTRFEPNAFDGGYASFGPLNCELDLAHALGQIAAVLKPQAPFLTSVVSRPCAVELGVSGLRLRFPKAFRRLQGSTMIDLYGAGSVRARAYSEAELRRALSSLFEIERLEGWLVLLPPPYMARPWGEARAIHRPIEWLDDRMRRTWPFRGWGDHIHVWTRRRKT